MSHVHGQSYVIIPIDDVQFKTIENVAFADHITLDTYTNNWHNQ